MTLPARIVLRARQLIREGWSAKDAAAFLGVPFDELDQSLWGYIMDSDESLGGERDD